MGDQGSAVVQDSSRTDKRIIAKQLSIDKLLSNLLISAQHEYYRDVSNCVL